MARPVTADEQPATVLATPPGAPPAGAEQPAIAVQGLEKRYGSTTALDGISFAVEPGEVFGILGPNGAGKTTTVEILEGYRQPDAGTATVLGLDPLRDGAALKQRIGVMLQEGGLPPGLRPLEVLELFAAFYTDADDPARLLARVGLDARRGTPVRRLSGGEVQRLSLACALVGRPDVLFLDEPTAGMDPRARATTWELVRAQRDLGRTVVLTTHLMDEAEALCDRIAILAGGRVAALGTPSELTHGTETADVWFSAAPGLAVGDLARALGLPAGGVVEDRPGEYVVHAPGTPQRVADLAVWLRDHDIALGALHATRRSLEAVFLQITADDAAAESAVEE
jgi:ABC-2 type transport system ATP-binding protein